MPVTKPTSQPFASALHELIMDRDTLQFSDFRAISDTMMDGYASLVRLGLPGDTIALAMLGGTINLYELFGLRSELPQLLRSLADWLENDPIAN